MKDAAVRNDREREARVPAQLSTFARLIAETQEQACELRSSSDERLLIRALVDQLPDLLFVKDTECRFVVANKAIATAYGFETPGDLIGKSDFDLHPFAAAQGFFDREQEVIRSGAALTDLEETFPDSAGVQRWYSTIKMPLRNRTDEVIGLVGVCRDITERKLMDSLRIQQGAILEMIAKNAPLSAVLDRLVRLIESQVHGITGSILLFDAEQARLRLGSAPNLPATYNAAVDGAAIGPKAGSCGTAAWRRERVIVTDIQSDPLWDDHRHLVAGLGLRSCWSTPILSHEGQVLGTFAMYSGEVRSPNPTETGLIEATTRIAGIAIERQRSEDRIRFIAHHDALTGLPNRTLLRERIAHVMQRADREGSVASVVFIDLDDFKVVNDGLGHFAGDKLLQVIAERMSGCIGSKDAVVRLGGDEFVVLSLAVDEGPDGIGGLLQSVRTAIAQPVQIGGRSLQVTCSIGVARYPADGRDVDALLMNADAAMYSAKERGRDNVRFYSAEMNKKVLDRLFIQQQLRHAIERSELHVLYQPQIDLRSGRIFAVEALLRWRHPTLGDVPPSTFIPIAEDSGLIVPIGDWVLRAACRQNRTWQDRGVGAIVMSVNVSARQFRDAAWVSRVEEALRDAGMAAHFLELEVTESMLMHDLAGATSTMRDLKALGVDLSIDDFGTGYSSLSALKSFPVSRLKIDRSFVQDLPEDENDRAIAAAVISLGQKLGLHVIAEGVETDAQLAFLRDNKCHEVQGYLFSKPVSPDEIEAMMVAQAAAFDRSTALRPAPGATGRSSAELPVSV